VGDDFNLVHEVFSIDNLYESLSEGVIKLIPITLLSVSYKIMAKALALRVWEVDRTIVLT